MAKKPEQSELKYAFCKDGNTRWNIMERKEYLPNGWYTIATAPKENYAQTVVDALNAANAVKNK